MESMTMAGMAIRAWFAAFLFMTQDSVRRAVDAHAGHCVAQFPTLSQSWQRYADLRGKCSIALAVILSPD